MGTPAQFIQSLSPENQGRLAILAITLLGWGGHGVVEGRMEHQLDQAHELGLEELPPHLQQWVELQARQEIEEGKLEDSVSLARRGFSSFKHVAQDITLAALYANAVMDEVKSEASNEHSGLNPANVGELSSGGDISRR